MGQATSPQTGGQQSSGSLKSMKEKPGKEDKELQETSGLKTAGPEGEITAGMHVLCTFISSANCLQPSPFVLMQLMPITLWKGRTFLIKHLILR